MEPSVVDHTYCTSISTISSCPFWLVQAGSSCCRARLWAQDLTMGRRPHIRQVGMRWQGSEQTFS